MSHQQHLHTLENMPEDVDRFHCEQWARSQGYTHVAGVDEAGRGPLAGPVSAAACILPVDAAERYPGLNDSKKLTERQRDLLFEQLTNDPTVIYAIALADHEKIDEVNILQATIYAMQEAVKQLSTPPDLLLVDGLRLPYPEAPVAKMIRGDGRSAVIGAASILAKVTRDRLMKEYDQKWPVYGFAGHKGYGTAKHRKAIEEHGPCPIHRTTFEPIRSLVARGVEICG